MSSSPKLMRGRFWSSATWSRVGPVAWRAFTVALLALVFVLASAVGVVLQLGTAPGRRFIAETVSGLVSAELVSDLRIERIDVLSPSHLVVSRAVLVDRLGKPLFVLEGVDARFNLAAVVGGVTGDDIRVAVPEIAVERLSFHLTRDPEKGGFTVETAFNTMPDPKPPGPSTPVFVNLPHITVRSASVTTDQPGIEKMKANLTGLAAGLDISPAGVVVSMKSGDLKVAGLLPRDVAGRLDSVLRLPGKTQASLDARAGNAPITASFAMSDQGLDLGAKSTELTPKAMRELIPAWPLAMPLEASARATGPPGSMTADLAARIGKGRVTGTGSLALAPEVATKLAIKAEDIDLRAFDPAAPETALDLDATLSLSLEGGLKLETKGTLKEGEILGYRVPPIALSATYTQAKFTGSATVLDPSLKTEVDVVISPDGKIEFSSKSPDLDLTALARYGIKARGRAAVHAGGVLERGRLTATLDASLRGPAVSGAGAGNAVVRGRIEGPIAKPAEMAIEADATVDALAAAGMTFDRVHATTKGSGTQQSVSIEVSRKPDLTAEASASVALGGTPILTDVRVESQGQGASLLVTAGRIVPAPGALTVSDVSLRAGEGTLAGSLSLATKRRMVDLTIEDLEIATVLAALGIHAEGARGRVDGRLKLEEIGSERTGNVALTLSDGAFSPIEGVSLELGAEFERSDIETRARFEVAGLGQGTLEGQTLLRSSVFAPRAVEKLTGTATLAVTDVALDEVSDQFLRDAGIGLRGRATAEIRATREDPGGLPELAVEFSTKKMEVSPAGAAAGFRLDVAGKGVLLAADGSRLTVEVIDGEGPWIAASVKHSLGAEGWARALDGDLVAAILAAPQSTKITAFRRPLRLFGAGEKSALDGMISGGVEATGTFGHPEIEAKASFSRSKEVARGLATQLDAELRYSARTETYDVEAHTVGEGDRIEIESKGRFSWLERGLGKDWSARGSATVARLRLAPLGKLIEVPLDGETRLKATFDVAPDRLIVDGELGLDRVKVEEHTVGSGTGRFKVAGGKASAALTIEHQESTLDFLAEAGVATQGGFELDPKRGGTLQLTARDFKLSALRPFVRAVATQVGGTLNGRAEVSFGPSDRGGRRATKLRANATITDGSVRMVAGGGLIQRVQVQALAEGDDPLTVKFSGAARAREPNVNGTLKLRLDGPRLKQLDAEVETESFPLVVDGVVVGHATTGKKAPIKVGITSKEEAQTVDVVIPAIEVVLPEDEDKTLIALDDDPSITVTEAALDPEADAKEEVKEPSKTTLKVRLGKRVLVKRGGLNVPFGGALTMAPDGRLTGSIVLPPGGVVPALGQIFRIRRGVVAFKNQDVNQGTLAIEATTRAADGTTVDLAVSGTIGEPVISFQSDPPRSEDEIVALLLGIQPDDTTNDGTNVGRTAMAVAMNQMLAGSRLSGLNFGAGETREGEEVTTVSMRVNQTVWIEGRTVQGSQTSVNQEDRVSGVVDWRFAPSWSLRTQLGDITGVELRWSHRY